MNYLKYISTDFINGDGVRATLFVSGCNHNCKGCFQQKSWSFNSGHQYTVELENQIIEDLKDSNINRNGLTLSGGDPLDPLNVPTLLRLVKRIKKEIPDKTIWAWTGFLLENLNEQQMELASKIDVLVDGKFEQSHYDSNLRYMGSSNQRVIDIKKTIEHNKLILYWRD